jgi:hypothetical protein
MTRFTYKKCRRFAAHVVKMLAKIEKIERFGYAAGCEQKQCRQGKKVNCPRSVFVWCCSVYTSANNLLTRSLPL